MKLSLAFLAIASARAPSAVFQHWGTPAGDTTTTVWGSPIDGKDVKGNTYGRNSGNQNTEHHSLSVEDAVNKDVYSTPVVEVGKVFTGVVLNDGCQQGQWYGDDIEYIKYHGATVGRVQGEVGYKPLHSGSWSENWGVHVQCWHWADHQWDNAPILDKIDNGMGYGYATFDGPSRTQQFDFKVQRLHSFEHFVRCGIIDRASAWSKFDDNTHCATHSAGDSTGHHFDNVDAPFTVGKASAHNCQALHSSAVGLKHCLIGDQCGPCPVKTEFPTPAPTPPPTVPVPHKCVRLDQNGQIINAVSFGWAGVGADKKYCVLEQCQKCQNPRRRNAPYDDQEYCDMTPHSDMSESGNGACGKMQFKENCEFVSCSYSPASGLVVKTSQGSRTMGLNPETDKYINGDQHECRAHKMRGGKKWSCECKCATSPVKWQYTNGFSKKELSKKPKKTIKLKPEPGCGGSVVSIGRDPKQAGWMSEMETKGYISSIEGEQLSGNDGWGITGENGYKDYCRFNPTEGYFETADTWKFNKHLAQKNPSDNGPGTCVWNSRRAYKMPAGVKKVYMRMEVKANGGQEHEDTHYGYVRFCETEDAKGCTKQPIKMVTHGDDVRDWSWLSFYGTDYWYVGRTDAHLFGADQDLSKRRVIEIDPKRPYVQFEVALRTSISSEVTRVRAVELVDATECSCKDDSTFTDWAGYTCAEWAGYDCKDAEYWGASEDQADELFSKCRKQCGFCESDIAHPKYDSWEPIMRKTSS